MAYDLLARWVPTFKIVHLYNPSLLGEFSVVRVGPPRFTLRMHTPSEAPAVPAPGWH